MRRLPLIAITALMAVLALPSMAIAGGWAMTTFDEVPEEFAAGQTYELTYTVLQHGKTPVDVGTSVIRITDSAGNLSEFTAASLGEPGRYSVAVAFPVAGAFTWEVTQGPFEPQQLGKLSVVGATAAAVTTGNTLRWLLPIALVLMIGLLAMQAVHVARGRPGSAVRAE
ncbi:MAG: hypothetical protein ACT4OP_11675 [Actinomycetota bacterium]